MYIYVSKFGDKVQFCVLLVMVPTRDLDCAIDSTRRACTSDEKPEGKEVVVMVVVVMVVVMVCVCVCVCVCNSALTY